MKLCCSRATEIAALLSILFVATVISGTASGSDEGLLSNPGMEAGDDGPADWPTPEGVTWEEEGGNRFLRLEPTRSDQMITVYRTVDVDNEHEAYELSFRVRHAELERGTEAWHDGRVILDFKDADGEKLSGSPGHPNFHGTSDGWLQRTVRFAVPAGAAKLEIMPALFQVEGGTFDIDDVHLTAISPDALPQPPAPLASETITPEGHLPPELHVAGDRLETAAGERVWLQGVNVASLEWSNTGEQVLESIGVAINDWNANVIRLPVDHDRWFGRAGGQDDRGKAYRQRVDEAIEAVARRDAYLVLDLHKYRAPTPDHLQFWLDVATRYRNHPAVIFGLLNEPHDISWDVWRNGESEEADDAAEFSGDRERLEALSSPGMQHLLEAVRAVGARNVVTASGLDWGYDLSGILEGYALEDPDGNGVVYETHVYPWKRDWQKRFLEVAREHPVLLGEVGAPKERFDFIPESAHEAAETWVPDVLAIVQEHRLHWTAWCFHPDAAPVLLKDWSYAPSEHWGAAAKRALHGESFELQRKR